MAVSVRAGRPFRPARDTSGGDALTFRRKSAAEDCERSHGVASILAPRRPRSLVVGMSNSKQQHGNGTRALGAGLTLAASVGLFAYAGLWLDTQFGTRPLCLLLCTCCGIVGGILHLIRVLAPDQWPFGKSPGNGGSPPRA
jgi:F0F1-type ATP synthase assembly protein I